MKTKHISQINNNLINLNLNNLISNFKNILNEKGRNLKKNKHKKK